MRRMLTILFVLYIRCFTENLSNMVPDSWYSMYHYSHPPLLERLRAIEKHTAAKKNE